MKTRVLTQASSSFIIIYSLTASIMCGKLIPSQTMTSSIAMLFHEILI